MNMANADLAKGEVPNENLVKVYEIAELDKLEIVMHLDGNKRTIYRAMDEQVGKALERIEVNVKNANKKKIKLLDKKLKKSLIPDKLVKPIPSPTPKASLHDKEGNAIDPYISNKRAWLEAKTLQICDKTFLIAHNPPSITSLRIVPSPIVGLPIYPRIELKHASMEDSKFFWYRKKIDQTNETESMDTNDEEVKTNERKRQHDNSLNEESDIHNDEEWESVSNDKIYITTNDDFGYRIRLKVIPGNENFFSDQDSGEYQLKTAVTVSEGVVQAGPGKFIFDDRHQHTTTRCKHGSFRFVCYNILADTYANTEFAKEMLFPYCPLHALDVNYRQQIIVKELSGYNADLICLQEVDRFVFESMLMPTFSGEGFAGAFAAKDQIKEGVAILYRRDKFRLLHIDNVAIRKAIKEERNSDLWLKVQQNEKFTQNFLARTNCVLVALLQSVDDPDKHILLGNTHLYWHPRGGQIRLLQTEILLRELRDTYNKYSSPKGCKEREITFVVTGDFNSNPYTGVVDLLTKGNVPSNHSDWFTLGIQEHISDTELHNPTKFESACSYPNYTNYVTGFNACLDYIFIEPKDLQVERVIPQPLHDDVTRHTALPNKSAPSDHIAQVVDLTWVRRTGSQTT